MSVTARLFPSTPMAKFALIGAVGAVMNLLIMLALVDLGMEYVGAAIAASEITIISNFVMQERYVFNDGAARQHPVSHRFLHSFTFNTTESFIRTPFLWCLVELTHIASPVAQGLALAASFFLRYAFHQKLVYAKASVIESGGTTADIQGFRSPRRRIAPGLSIFGAGKDKSAE
ncbi:GtrA family protein [Arthrobacter sp. NicSoilC5]|uniref:GtrA family protein n=1 Tax=Arthrobacter sp. NicSoilC5 TaxID=2831000 RepID=UPI001CC62544|nr:GtrA family protein [Arthrobacter sp. NicSoilC5]BCW79720.1 hypothetical protein NicSoilC5_17390 [Arthrobacter sp. NicSoilC5]